MAVITARDDAGNAITAIPYCVWDNRAAGKMNVWVRQDGLRPLLAPRDRVVRYFTEEIPESAGEEDITRAVPRLLARTRAYLAKDNGWYEGDLPILYRPLSDKDFQ